MLEATLPGVVLVVNERADRKIFYGSGILLDDHGRILTNLHVVANARALKVLLFDKKRTSYIPADGGLARYLFESEADQKAAKLQKGDPALDLAVIHVDTDTSAYPRLAFRAEPVRVGERVLALGHPSETVWSFSAGLVSSVHSGIVQTDAAINHGNSGGPLIDTQGRVVGLNTSKLFGDAQGIGFARPIGLTREIIDGSVAPLALDLSSPERGVASCVRAWELASPAVADCLDDESGYEFMVAAWRAVEVKLKMTPDQIKAMRTRTEGFGKARWIAFRRSLIVASVKGDRDAADDALDRTMKAVRAVPTEDPKGVASFKEHSERADVKERIREAMDSVKAYEASYDQRFLARTGMKVDRKNPNAEREITKMGLRVDKVGKVGDDRAWVAIVGRNLDGTLYRYSELWLRRGERWHEKGTPTPDDVKTLPEGFPPSHSDYEADLAEMVNQMIVNMEWKKKEKK